MEKIFDISKVPLPFTEMVGKDTAMSNRKEWTIDSLAVPDTSNKNIDGAAASGNDGVVGDRVSNFCQISDKVVEVSDRANNVAVFGRGKNEFSYQLMRRQQELRRDVEAICLLNQASLQGDGSNAAKVGGLPAWLKTNDYFGAGGASGGFNTGTGVVDQRTVSVNRRALSEADVRTAAQDVYNQGGDPSVLMTRPEVISRLSTRLFASTAVAAIHNESPKNNSGPATAMGAINVFVTDLGSTLKMVPNRIMQTHNDGSAAACSDVFLLDPEYLSIAYLQGYQTKELGAAGLSRKWQISVDWTLCVLNEAAHAIIADINGATAATA